MANEPRVVSPGWSACVKIGDAVTAGEQALGDASDVSFDAADGRMEAGRDHQDVHGV